MDHITNEQVRETLIQNGLDPDMVAQIAQVFWGKLASKVGEGKSMQEAFDICKKDAVQWAKAFQYVADMASIEMFVPKP